MSTLLRSRPTNVEPVVLIDDAGLVARAKSKREDFTPLYRRYVGPVYRYCYYRLGSREDAEDATSQVFTQALAGIAGCRDESFRSWLFAIAHNVVSVFAPGGAFLYSWGGLGLSEGKFLDPFGIALDGAGGVYVTEGGSPRIQKFLIQA